MIYLASQSARRKEILQKAKIPFQVVHSDFEEKTFSKNPVKTVILNALGKAKNARVKNSKGIVLGADTIVYQKGKIIGKPKDLSEAYYMLIGLSGTVHFVYTGFALCHLETGKWTKGHEMSRVKMKKILPDQIISYFKQVNPLDKAGSYAIQESGDWLIEKIEGSYFNVVGLPIERIKKALKQLKKA